MEIKAISHKDSILHEVIALGDKNKQTLGMLPEGAFLHHARKKTIIIAVENGKLSGYLLYRISQRKRLVSITHLCVADEYQGKGVSTALLHKLKSKYENLFSGIALTCRADYQHASKLWEKFGFKPRDKKPSRSKRGQYHLIRWIYDFGNPHLFSELHLDKQKVRAVLDSSIVIPLSENENLVPEITALHADWLEDDVEYMCTQEIYNDLNRDENLPRAERTRKYLRRFDMAQFKPDERDQIAEDLKAHIPGKTPNDVSDRKQLAECIAAGIPYFITMDKGIHDLSEELSAKYRVDVLRPAEFVMLQDELYHSLDYKAFRLAGANYDLEKLKGTELEKLVDAFGGIVLNEKKSDLRGIISRCTTNTKGGGVKVIKNRQSEAIAMYGLQVTTTETCVELIRIKQTKVSTVLFQQIVRDIVLLTVNQKMSRVQITEPNIGDDERAILEIMGFVFLNNRWEKLCLSGIQSIDEVLINEHVKNLYDTQLIGKTVQSAPTPLGEILKIDFERKLWPLKLADADIPTYIIPIRPYWASQLFDFYLANTSLYGASESLTWSRENVYYRSVKPVSERTPGRILWYISSEEKFTGRSRGIAATSYLDEVTIDRTKAIFRKFKNFGVYEWKDIYNLANKEIMSEIKALKFSDTEVFKKIIPLERINEIMLKHNRPKNTFPSPVEVSKEIFNEIYQIGINE